MSVLGPSTWTSAASTGSVGASTAATSTAAGAASPITHQPSSAVAPMASGMPISSSRQVDAHARHVAQERRCRGRSSASPTPISATSTQNSVRCSVSARWSTGEMVELPGSSPMPAPTTTSTMGADSATLLSAVGSTTPSSNAAPPMR